MINTNELIGEMAKNGFNKTQMARELGITLKTFSKKLETGKLGTNEMEAIIEILQLDKETACKIFFASCVTQYAPNTPTP